MDVIVFSWVDENDIAGQVVTSTPEEMLAKLKAHNAECDVGNEGEDYVVKALECHDLQTYVNEHVANTVGLSLIGHGKYRGLYE